MKCSVKKNIIPGLAMLLALSFDTPLQAEDMKSIIRRGNIVSTTYDDEEATGRYLGNGRFGTVISAHGMNLSPDEQASRRTGASHITHLMHWTLGQFLLSGSNMKDKDGKAEVTFEALRDCSFSCKGKNYVLKKGETTKETISL